MTYKTTAATGYLVDGNFGISATICERDSGGFVAVNRNSGGEHAIDPVLTQWISQRAVTGACIRAGLKGEMHLVRLDKIAAELRKDKKAVLYSTKQFVEKMELNATRAAEIIAGLDAEAATLAKSA